MQFINVALTLIAAAGITAADPIPAARAAPPGMPAPGPVTDLASCLDYAKKVPNPVASLGWQDGCHQQFGDAAQQNISARAIEYGLDVGLQKRCKDEHASCCCQAFCLDEVACPVCIAGCEASCVTQFGGDCAGGGNDCGTCD